MIKAIIFDMDGVLIDAKDWHYESLNKALGLFGYNISRYEHLVTYDGLPTKDKLQMLSKDRGFPNSLHKFTNEMKQIYTMELVYAKCKPNFIHEYALSKLKSEGYKIVVCSNSIKKTVETMMEKSSLLEYLDFYLSNEDVQSGKPSPEIYNKAIARLKLRPEECLIVEDNENGIKAAIASGSHLFKVQTVMDVTYSNIKGRVQEILEARND